MQEQFYTLHPHQSCIQYSHPHIQSYRHPHTLLYTQPHLHEHVELHINTLVDAFSSPITPRQGHTYSLLQAHTQARIKDTLLLCHQDGQPCYPTLLLQYSTTKLFSHKNKRTASRASTSSLPHEHSPSEFQLNSSTPPNTLPNTSWSSQHLHTRPRIQEYSPKYPETNYTKALPSQTEYGR